MTDDEKTMLVVAGLIWWLWYRESTSVNIDYWQTCPDGSVIPFKDECPTN